MADKLFGTWGRWAAITATIMASLSAFSVTLGASARIMRPGLAQLYEFGIGAASLLDAAIPAQAQVAGKAIRDLVIPEECLIAAIIREGKFVVPRGETRLMEDDRVVFIGPAAVVHKAADMVTKQ